ncbi:2-dehydropantoate 2-reductase [Acidovorax lacteus]|uniref:2-dehydropantoate 2-reductase n=1 Tax=Acidovorax lacteus TaxID=1924988 RepID=A0ABP8L8D8_9BURK
MSAAATAAPQAVIQAVPGTVVVLGAGSIGAYVGGALQAAGVPVVLVGRARMAERIARHGLRLSDLAGRQTHLPAEAVRYTQDPAALAQAVLVLVAVKSGDTDTAAATVARHAPAGAVVLSLQNGIGHAERLRAALPGRTVLAGMVPFNVVQTPDGRLHRGTFGELMVEAHPAWAAWHAGFAAAHLPLQERPDMPAVQWGKLLLNLNNPVNALSGQPLQRQLSQRAYRRVLAAAVDEALAALRAHGITPAAVGAVAPRWLPTLLRLPDALFRRVAARMLRMDPEARSSMWEDLQAGRLTEVEALNGAVVRLAAQAGREAPVNARLCALVHAAESGGPRDFSGPALWQAVRPG